MPSTFFTSPLPVLSEAPADSRAFRDALTEANLVRMTWLLLASTVLSVVFTVGHFIHPPFSPALFRWQLADIGGSLAFLALFALSRRGAFSAGFRWSLAPAYFAFWLALMQGYYFHALRLYGENITFAAGAVTPALIIFLPLRYSFTLLAAYFLGFVAINLLVPSVNAGRNVETIAASLVNGALAVIVGGLAAWFGYRARRANFDKEQLLIRRNADIRRAESNVRAILENIPFQAWLKDTEGRFLAVNQEFARAVSLRQQSVIGLTPADIYPRERASQYVDEDRDIMTKAERVHLEQSVDFTDGTAWYEVFKSPVIDDQGQCLGTAGMARDITSRRKMEDQLRAANAAKSEFLAAMSHEIRTPMNSVLGYAQLLRDLPLEASGREYVESIISSGEVLLCVINDILDFSKIEAGQLRLAPTNFPLRPLLHRCLRIFEPQAASKNLSLRLEIAAPLPDWVHGDSLRLEQILINLLSNAVKFTPAGAVTLKVHADPVLHFSVQDTGIGITPEQLDRLFRPFSQADSAIARRFSGTGLGLVITQRLCQLMGGGVRVVSSPGQGSTFTADLPLAAANADLSPAPAAAPAPSRADFSDLRVLVVEDNAPNRKLLSTVLRRYHIEAAQAESGEEAVRFVEENFFDLIFMDVQMPGMDGFETTRLIRAHEAKNPATVPRSRIVALTALAMAGDAERCYEAGMDGYLTKPINPGRIEQTLRESAVQKASAAP